MTDIHFSEKPHHISTKNENRGYVQCHFTEPHCTLLKWQQTSHFRLSFWKQCDYYIISSDHVRLFLVPYYSLRRYEASYVQKGSSINLQLRRTWKHGNAFWYDNGLYAKFHARRWMARLFDVVNTISSARTLRPILLPITPRCQSICSGSTMSLQCKKLKKCTQNVGKYWGILLTLLFGYLQTKQQCMFKGTLLI